MPLIGRLLQVVHACIPIATALIRHADKLMLSGCDHTNWPQLTA